jgi:capsular polysaccharide transport system permease protein
MPNTQNPSHTITNTMSLKDLWQCLCVQIRVIKALVLREMITRFGRHNIGFLWMFVEPMMFSIGITILWTYMGGHAKGTIPVAGFALTGYSAIVAWRNCVGRTSNSIKANKALLYHRMVTIFDIAISRGLLEFAAVTVSFLVLSILFTELGLMHLPSDPLQVVIGWILLGWFVIAAGLIAVYLDERSEIFERVWHVAMYLTLPFTGAFTMVSWLPEAAQTILLYSPMVNAVEMLREGYFGSGINAQYSISYLITCNIAVTALALLLIQRVNKIITAE